MEYWSIGVMEYWSIGIYGVLGRHLNTPILHYSTTPAATRATRHCEIPCFQVITGPAFPFAGEPLAEIRGIYRGTL
jgi:hypothetical protein